MPYSAGTIFLEVVPSFHGVQTAARREAQKAFGGFAREAEKELAKVERNAQQATERTTKSYGNAVTKRFQRDIKSMQDSIANLPADLKIPEGRDGIGEIRRQLAQVAKRDLSTSLGTTEALAGVQRIRDNLQGIFDDVDRNRRAGTDPGASNSTLANLGALREMHDSILKDLNTWMGSDPKTVAADKERLRLEERKQALGKQQLEARRLMDREFLERGRERLAAIDAEMTATQKLGRMQEQAAEMMRRDFAAREEAEQRLGNLQDRARRAMESDEARDEASRKDRVKKGIERDLREISETAGNASRLRIGIDVDEEEALREANRVRVLLDATFAEAASLDVDVDDMAAARSARRAVAAAQRAIDSQVLRLRTEADTATARAQLLELRSTMAALSDDVQINPDVDTTAARAQIMILRQGLESLRGSVDVNGDILRLERLERQLREVDRQAATTQGRLRRFDAGGAANSVRVFNGVLLTALAIGPLLVPVLAVLAGGFIGVGVAALGAVAGVGVLFAALAGVGGAVKAMSELNKAKRTAPGGAGTKGASDRSAITDARALADAQKALGRARTDAARAAEDAAERVADAEQTLVEAQRAALATQVRLNDARAQAVRDLEDMNNQLAAARLGEQEAGFAVQEAGVHLNVVLEDDQATDREKAKAKLAYDQAQQQYKEQALSLSRLEKDTAEANAAGVEGAESVIAAKDDILEANKRAIEAEEAVTDAHRAAADSRVQSAERIAEAEMGIVQAIEDAQLRAVEAAAATGAMTTATNNLEEAMRNLSPAGQEFARWLYSLSPLLKELRFGAQTAFLPGLQAALTQIIDKYGPGMIAFVTTMSGVLGDMALAAAEALTGPFWSQFFDTMAELAPTFLNLFGTIGGGLLTFFAGLADAFAPLALIVMSALAEMSTAIGDWASTVKETEGFQTFLGYLVDTAPLVGELFSNLFEIVGKLLIGLVPYTDNLLTIFIAITGWLASLDPDTLARIAVGFILIVGAIQVFAGIISVVTGIVGLLAAGSVGLIATAVIAVVLGITGAIVYLWTTSEGFRNAMKTIWQGVKDAFLGPLGLIASAVLGIVPLFGYLMLTNEGFRDGVAQVWSSIWSGLKTTVGWIVDDLFPALMAGWQATTEFFGRMYNTYLEPVLGAIGSAMGVLGAVFLLAWTVIDSMFIQPLSVAVAWLWENVLSPVFSSLIMVINEFVAPVFLTLWENAIKPTFDLISAIFTTTWAVMSTIFDAIYQIITFVVAPVFTWLYNNVISPIMTSIAGVISDAWTIYIKPIFDALSSYIELTVAPAFQKAVDFLGTIWGGLLDLMRTPIRLAIEYVINKGLIGAFNWLADKVPGMTKLDEVVIPAALQPGGVMPGAKAGRPVNAGMFADGGTYGTLPGYSPGRDNMFFVDPSSGTQLSLAGGEPIMRPEFGAAVGPGWVDRMNKAARQGGVGGVRKAMGFASGGIFKGGVGGFGLDDILSAIKNGTKKVSDFLSNPAGTLRNVVEDAAQDWGITGTLGDAAVGVALKPIDSMQTWIRSLLGLESDGSEPRGRGGSFGGGTGTPGNAMGYQAQIAAIQAAFPGIGITSTYRPGAVTAVGTASYHGKGRAIDIAPSMAAFDWLAATYPNSRELIYTPAGGRQILNGNPFNGWAPITKQMHKDHVHWAMANGGIVPDLYDNGGDLAPGLSLVANKTGKPERVVTEKMMNEIRTATSRGGDINLNGEFNGYTPDDIVEAFQKERRREYAVSGMDEIGAMVL